MSTLGPACHLLLTHASSLLLRLTVLLLLIKLSGLCFALEALLPLLVSLVLLQLFVLGAAHIIHLVIHVLVLATEKLGKFCVLGVLNFRKLVFDCLLPKFFHAGSTPLGTVRLAYLRKLVESCRHQQRLVVIDF